jgi:hypothetical protein
MNGTNRADMLFGVLSGDGIFSLILKGEYRWKVSENRVQKIVCGHKKQEVTGGWK